MIRYVAIACMAFTLAGCAQTDFVRYEGRADLNSWGTGGTRSTVDGIDFWEHGDPPRRYRLLGTIDDERSHGLIPQLRKRGEIAAKAREAGGDAVLLLESSETVTGHVETGVGSTTTSYGDGTLTTGVGTTVSVPVGRTNARYAVIRYLD